MLETPDSKAATLNHCHVGKISNVATSTKGGNAATSTKACDAASAATAADNATCAISAADYATSQTTCAASAVQMNFGRRLAQFVGHLMVGHVMNTWYISYYLHLLLPCQSLSSFPHQPQPCT